MNALSAVEASPSFRLAFFGLSPDAPEWLGAVLSLVFIYFCILIPYGLAMTYLWRKLGADLQARVGPNRAGWAGVLQPVADIIKLLQKERGADDTVRVRFWMVILTMALYCTVAVLPFGSVFLLLNTDMSAFLLFWTTLVLGLGTMLLGFNQFSVPGWLGGTRIAIQAVVGAFPALISILCVGLTSGGFRWSWVVGNQGFSPLHWNCFLDPFHFIAFCIFMASGLVLLSGAPLEAGISLNEIRGGVMASLSGRRLALFLMGRFYGLFLWCLLATVLFCGAWVLPSWIKPFLAESSWVWLQVVLENLVLLSKTGFLMLVLCWISRVSPRVRVDQVTEFSWKILSPLALFALIGCTLWQVGILIK